MNEISKQWSVGLREATRDALLETPILHDGLIHMKQIEGRFGSMTLTDLLAGKYAITIKPDGPILDFPDVDAVIDAGWAID